MRFLVKTAFLLGLASFALPGSGSGDEAAPPSGVSWFTALSGAQQAMTDFAGFCDRAPAACQAGQEFAVFAGERVADGMLLAYRAVGAPADRPEGGDSVSSNPSDVATLGRDVVASSSTSDLPAAATPNAAPPVPTPAPRA